MTRWPERHPSGPRLETDCCGHVFDTEDERIDHENAVNRGVRVWCPCGDVCSDGDPFVRTEKNGYGR